MSWTERYVRADADGTGDGTTDANSGATGSWTLTQAIANVVAGHLVNVKAGTFSLSAAFTMAVAGTVSSPIHWRGYSSTIGDLDTATDHTTFPWFDMTGEAVFATVSGNFNWWSNIRLTADNTSASSAALVWNCISGRLFRCHIVAEAADADGHAVAVGALGDGSLIYNNHMQAPTTAASCIEVDTAGLNVTIASNYISGGAIGVNPRIACLVVGNVITGTSAQGVYTSGSRVLIVGNTLHAIGTIGIQWATAVSSHLISNNIFSDIGTFAISSTDAGDKSTLVTNNAYWDITTAQLENIDEQFNAITCAASPFVNAGTGDFTPSAEVKALGFPTRVGLASTLTYVDIGAVQAQAGSGGGTAQLLGNGLLG